ncbi:Protein REVEILLE 6 [Zea mays]|jgi:hypothetical protein|uniref:Protein REVEILLE 6 n=1 Tax=Zea mays TaxID=4577 RepID=A0A1D6HFY8_MAIZE|nr:Protein REVEILLE 6 [Zea mays]
MIVYFDPLVIAMFSLGVWYSGSCFSVLLFASFLYGICPLVEVSFTFLKILVSRTMLSMMLCHFCCVYTLGVATLKNPIRSACKEATRVLCSLRSRTIHDLNWSF